MAVEEEALEALWALGVRDSKLVPRGRRRALVRAMVQAGARGRVVVIPASRVDQENLTLLELEAMALLLRALGPAWAVVDAPVGPRAAGRFRSALATASGLELERIAVFPRADRTHPAAAAASLLAKVVRDSYILLLRRAYGDFGWGYPGEAKVRAFLATWFSAHGALPPICRSRWRSVQNLLALPLLEKVAARDGSGENGG
ncbi:MAG: hypothetical protein N2320_03990 [Candidatus Bipolaricaulota bacterium]|nr:hypothetical protein [Candidatus Bipolaricaulota bacterium]